jgi:hypothetical protein
MKGEKAVALVESLVENIAEFVLTSNSWLMIWFKLDQSSKDSCRKFLEDLGWVHVKVLFI